MVEIQDSHSLPLGPEPLAAAWCALLMSLGCRALQLVTLEAVAEALIQSGGPGHSRDEEDPAWAPILHLCM